MQCNHQGIPHRSVLGLVQFKIFTGDLEQQVISEVAKFTVAKLFKTVKMKVDYDELQKDL